MVSESQEKNYVAMCQHCGQMLGACGPTTPDRAKVVAQWLRCGDSVERKTDAEVRAAPWGHKPECQDAPKPKKKKAKKFDNALFK